MKTIKARNLTELTWANGDPATIAYLHCWDSTYFYAYTYNSGANHLRKYTIDPAAMVWECSTGFSSFGTTPYLTRIGTNIYEFRYKTANSSTVAKIDDTGTQSYLTTITTPISTAARNMIDDGAYLWVLSTLTPGSATDRVFYKINTSDGTINSTFNYTGVFYDERSLAYANGSFYVVDRTSSINKYPVYVKEITNGVETASWSIPNAVDSSWGYIYNNTYYFLTSISSKPVLASIDLNSRTYTGYRSMPPAFTFGRSFVFFNEGTKLYGQDSYVNYCKVDTKLGVGNTWYNLYYSDGPIYHQMEESNFDPDHLSQLNFITKIGDNIYHYCNYHIKIAKTALQDEILIIPSQSNQLTGSLTLDSFDQSIHSSDRRDHAFDAIAGYQYTFTLDNAVITGASYSDSEQPSIQGLITIIDENENEITRPNKTGGHMDKTLTWVAPITKRYYLRIRSEGENV